jgi:hypothetical protein
MDALSATRDDVYAFTHVLLYATDLGRCRIRLPRPAHEILADATAALGRCLLEQDYDLGGEVLLAWPLLHSRWCAAAVFGLTVLSQVEDEAGFLPTANISLERCRQLSGEDRSRYVLATSYHTAYVMGLLCAAALQGTYSPPSAVPRSRRATDALVELIGYLKEQSQDQHWMRTLAHLDSRQQRPLVPLLLSMGLRSAATARDLPAVQMLLRLAAGLDVVDLPPVRQGVELLDRARLLSAPSTEPLASDGPRPRPAL